MSRLLGPLPENAFVAAARDTIPIARERERERERESDHNINYR
jgi:hypothetical protein